MAELFSPFQLRSLELRNRIVVSPMGQYKAVDGCAQAWHLMHLGGFAKSNPGLVILEATAVSPEGRIGTTDVCLFDDRHESALRALVADIRSFSATPLGIQLNHAGRKASSAKVPGKRKSMPLLPEDGGWRAVGPSPIPYAPDWPLPSALDAAGLAAVKAQWVDAARRAARAGFDLIEIHAAHGYLLSSFLSPLSNTRTDAYGGSARARMRFPLEVFEACRAAWSDSKPMGVRINGSDWADGGVEIGDAVDFAGALKEAGADYIVASAGALLANSKLPPLVPGYMADYAAQIRARTGLATMAVGLVVKPAFADKLVADGLADLVAVGRAFLHNPNWTYDAAAVLRAEHVYEGAYGNIQAHRWPGYPLVYPEQV